MNVLGVAGGFGHDAAACLVVDGDVRAMVEEERLSGVKRAAGASPRLAIRWCLGDVGVEPGDIDAIALSWDPALDPSATGLAMARDLVVEDPLWAGSPPPAVPVGHHHAHAASAHLTGGADHAAVIVLDGNGEDVATTVWEARAGALALRASWPASQSVGHFYNAVTEHAGLGRSESAGKLMGLAAYGTVPSVALPIADDADGYRLRVPALDDLPAGERFRAIAEHWRAVLFTSFGPPVVPAEWSAIPDGVPRRAADIAAWAQATVAACLLGLAETWCRRLGTRDVAMAGGVALNCSANGALAASGVVDSLYVQPAAHDAGGALGAALVVAGARPAMKPFDPFLGPEAGAGAAVDAARARGLTCERLRDPVATAAERLAAGAVLGWVQGRCEVGPRALGHRSMIALPAPAAVRDQVNRVKGRERWRPLSPSVRGMLDVDSPYMLLAIPVPDALASGMLAATVHVDGTARPQTVRDGDAFDPLLAHLGRELGVPALLNTSLNLAGEPIVADGVRAVGTLARSQLDGLVVDDVLVTRPS